MAEDIFKYSPVTEWNGMVVEFDMPSTTKVEYYLAPRVVE